MIKTILNENDVVVFSDMGSNVARCTIKDIVQVERFEFLRCLGMDFYKELLADRVDYSSVINWEEGTEYALDVIVNYEGTLYISTAAANTSEPINGDWDYADKFETEEFNNLLCNEGLGRFLSMSIQRNKIVRQSIRFEDVGVVRKRGDTFDSATLEELQAVSVSLKASISQLWEYLDYYLKNNNVDGIFDNYKGNNENCCNVCGSSTCNGCDSAKNEVGRYVSI